MRHLSFAIAGALAALAGCPSNNPVECRDQSSCDLATGGQCLTAPSGNQWCAYPDPSCPSGQRYSDQSVGDGLSGVCVPGDEDPDAGVDARPDGPNIDAPPGVVIVNNQGADVVLGQADFTTAVPNFGGVNTAPTDKSMKYPNGAAFDGTSIWVTDAGEGRVLRWSSPVPSSYVPAANLVGKASFTDPAPTGVPNAGNMDSTCCGPRVAAVSNRVLVADTGRHRVMIWTPLPSTNGQTANLVLGQVAFNANTATDTAGGLNAPNGVWTDGTKVVVADTGNNRVLIWTTFPTSNGEPADLVIGQTDFGISTLPPTPTSSNMRRPRGVYFDGTRLFVADSGHNRVLIWNSFPTTNGAAADVVLGQPDFVTATRGTSPATALAAPESVVSTGSVVFVADTFFDRVTAYNIPVTNGAAAFAVLGQSAPTVTPVADPAPTQSSLSNPTDVLVVGPALYVVDSQHHRVLRFALSL